jgi:hypothetical protein
LSGVVLLPDGRLTADSATIERLKRLCAEDRASLQLEPTERHPSAQPVDAVVRVAPAPSDDAVEALLGSLLIETFEAASKSYQLARDHTRPGQPVTMRDVCLDQAARLTRACAEVSTALMRSRGKGERMVIEHRHHHLHQRIS